MIRSFDGGKSFERPPRIVTHFETAGLPDPRSSGGLTFDGVAGARDGSFPTVDIANGAPTGDGATDQIVLAGRHGPDAVEHQPRAERARAGALRRATAASQWTESAFASPASDRPDFPAIAISPDGGDAYLTYMNFLQPWQSTHRAAAVDAGRRPARRREPRDRRYRRLERPQPRSDRRRARIERERALAEFLGDYNYAFATNDFVVAVWNDVRNAADCPAIDAYRQAVANGTAEGTTSDPTRPAPQQACLPTFGNTDIWGGSYADPTP